MCRKLVEVKVECAHDAVWNISDHRRPIGAVGEKFIRKRKNAHAVKGETGWSVKIAGDHVVGIRYANFITELGACFA